MHQLLRQAAAAARRGPLPPRQQKRKIFSYAAAHPEQATVVLGAAVAVVGYRLSTLEQALQSFQKREEELKDAALKDANDRLRKNEVIAELKDANDRLRKENNAMANEKTRLEASIMERGRAGEQVLEQVLDECKRQGIVKDYKLQHEIALGKRPDAVVEMMDDVLVVIDSKNPLLPGPDKMDEKSRKEYIDKLKGHVRQLGDKQYTPSASEQIPIATLMMLPSEWHVQACYDDNRKDIHSLHKFARDRNVLVIGPNGLRTLLQMVKVWLEDQAAKDRLTGVDIRENIVGTLQPLWLDTLLPFTKQMSNGLEKVVTLWNDKVDSIVAFDRALRSESLLNLPKPRKTQLPKKVSLPKPVDNDR